MDPNRRPEKKEIRRAIGNPWRVERLKKVAGLQAATIEDPSMSPEVAGEVEEERALLLAAAGGDEGAVREIFRTHLGTVHRAVSRILRRDDPNVDDVVQQVFLSALKGADSFAGRSKLSTWLVGIATRRALDEARSRWRRERFSRLRHQVGMNLPGLSIPGLGRPSSPPDLRGEALSVAERALGALNPEQRTVFVLHKVEGYTLKEVGEMTNTGISTLHARLKAARKRLDAVVEQLQTELEDDHVPA